MDSQELRALVRPLALASAPKCGENSGKPVSCPNLKVKREAGIDTLTLAGPPRVRKPSTKASESASPCWSGAKAGVDVGVGWGAELAVGSKLTSGMRDRPDSCISGCRYPAAQRVRRRRKTSAAVASAKRPALAQNVPPLAQNGPTLGTNFAALFLEASAALPLLT